MHSPRQLSRHRVGDPRRAALQASIAVLAFVVWCSPAAAATPDSLALRLPPDAVFQRVVGPDSAVVFRHGTHVPLASERCTACHPQLFRILTPTFSVTHADMNAGRSCGACHDGEHAFGTRASESCAVCHVGRATAAAAATRTPATPAGTPAYRGPKPITYSQGEVSPGSVTFQHATHARGACSQCHPKLFAMKTTPAGTNAKPRGDLHEVTGCGACHDSKKSFGVEDEQACAKCHREGGR